MTNAGRRQWRPNFRTDENEVHIERAWREGVAVLSGIRDDWRSSGEPGMLVKAGPPAASIAIHVLAGLVVLLLFVPHRLQPAAVRSIDVEIIPTREPIPEQAATSPRGPTISPVDPRASQPPAPAKVRAPLTGGMTEAKRLFSTGLLKEEASAEVRRTLPTLDPYERMTQLCDMEATEQIRVRSRGSNPETVSASAFAETEVKDGVLLAPGAAYRDHSRWFFLRFSCKVSADFSGVKEFRFAVGGPVPRDQWEDHDLIAVDEDDE